MNAKVCAMREIILINSTPFPTIPTLIVNTIHYLPLYKALLEVGINPQYPKDTINALIFTSKHAIKALLQELQTHHDMQDFLKIPAFAIGSGTACMLEQNGFNIEFVASKAYGASFGEALTKRLQNRSALYFRAQTIASNLDKELLMHIKLYQVIAYQNITKTLPQSQKPHPHSILIFTAPSNYISFVQNFGWDHSYIAVAIGTTTLRAFAQGITSYVSTTQTLEGCVEFARNLAKTLPK